MISSWLVINFFNQSQCLSAL